MVYMLPVPDDFSVLRTTAFSEAITKFEVAERARAVLKPSVNKDLVLIICGYSFGDTHINIELDRALRESEGQLAFVIFTFDEAPAGKVKEWTDDATIRDQVLIFAKRGFFHGTYSAPSVADLPWWKFENVTRLLKGDR